MDLARKLTILEKVAGAFTTAAGDALLAKTLGKPKEWLVRRLVRSEGLGKGAWRRAGEAARQMGKAGPLGRAQGVRVQSKLLGQELGREIAKIRKGANEQLKRPTEAKLEQLGGLREKGRDLGVLRRRILRDAESNRDTFGRLTGIELPLPRGRAR